ncbi:MAG: dUTP diphosphatase [Bacteroides sp.]|nr:dUTP diphosphatase [Bacteroides sp.]
MKIKTVKLKENAKLPYKATSGSAGADLFACIDAPAAVGAGEILLIPTGIAVEIPLGYGGFVFPRSSTASKHGISLANCVGVIDSDYRGEISVPVINHGNKEYVIGVGDRIAQLVIMPVEEAEYEPAEELSDTVRGSGGFGSTGI